MEVEVELSRIIINENSDQQVVFIKERGGERGFPIVIGIVEIFAIDRRLKGIKPPRPMTHDLLEQILDAMQANIEKIVITDLRQHTFFAKIYLQYNGKLLEIDSRPSDAIALGVAAKSPIFVLEHVFDKASL
ncbi:MAG: bifunctional nuclease family protein [Phycisphaerae bacterium]